MMKMVTIIIVMMTALVTAKLLKTKIRTQIISMPSTDNGGTCDSHDNHARPDCTNSDYPDPLFEIGSCRKWGHADWGP